MSVRVARPAAVAVTVVLAFMLCISVPAAAQQPGDQWEKEVAAFEAADRAAPAPRGEIVFVGSSSIARWDTAAAFPELTIVKRGFGGSELKDAVRYAERLVIPYQPRLVVVYAGDNDIWAGATSEEVAIHFQRLVQKLRAALPETRIVFIGVKPSVMRWSVVERVRAANALIRAYAQHDDRIAFVDVDGPMMGWDEKPRRELFVEDGLHLSAEGYRLWTMLLRPFLTPPAATQGSLPATIPRP